MVVPRPGKGKGLVSNVLPREKQLAVLAGLVEGNSERGVERYTERLGLGVTRKTIGRVALTLGTAAQHLHNSMAFNLATPDIEQDEIWSYVKKKQARCSPEESAAGLGEAYSFVSLAMPSRYVVTWTVGKRTQETAVAFEADTRARLSLMPRIATDGFNAYPAAIGGAFGVGVDYGQVVKHYTRGGRRDDDHRYEPPRDPFITKSTVFGAPDPEALTTAHVERFNGTTRHIIGRMRRLVYAFSKSLDHHRAAVSLAYCYYNLCWTPEKRKGVPARGTPAMEIGVTSHIWELDELLDALLAAAPCGTPERQPLTPQAPTTTARLLPGGRGFLRVVPSSGGPSTPSPGPAPAPTPATPAAPAVPDAPSGQLDLFAWKPPTPARPLPPPGTQLELF
jgi:hypothetical protein